ncbi:unnamed protein product [Nyctereutes procyonoides]|uniref:(raccoon dog) hypothetical protein n=1 Tax=Nyctereutes procyonoides TaxID=34880 RepID=A0A811YWG7_NYCPR|nr:unnamed protein product [Nyctereutes procyonoides]
MWNSGNQEPPGTRSRFPAHLTGDGQENEMFCYSCPTFSSALFSSASGYVAGDINRYYKEILDELLQELNSSISSDKHRGIRPPTTSIEGLRTPGSPCTEPVSNGASVQANMHDWDMNCHTPITVMPRELLQLNEADTESEVPAPWLLPASPPSAIPDLEQELMSSACIASHELQSVRLPAFLGIVTPSLNIEREPRPAPEAICYWCITPEHQLHEEKPGLMDFPLKLVAEQLTSVDVDLFKKLLPQQCLGFIWSKRNEPGNEHLACTVQATITQFNDVSNCVITTFLGNARMMARDRPSWWSTGSRWPSLTYIAVLSSGESWHLVCLALVQHEKGWVLAASNNRSPLTDRLWFSAFQGNEINHRKKNKECRFMTEIMLLQVAADHYNVEPKHPFRAWFQSGNYILSC